MKTLLIVDVQKSMGNWFSWSYIKKVYNFLKKNHEEYDQIFMIMEPQYPDNLRHDIEQLWDVNSNVLSEDILRSFKEDYVPDFILDYLTCAPIYKIYSKLLWENIEHNLELVELPPVLMRSYPIYLNDEYKGLIERLKDSSEVDIIGGGETKCVELTERLLKTQGIEPNVISSVCYDIRIVNSNKRAENTFDTTPAASIPKKIRDGQNSLKLTKIPFTEKSVTTNSKKQVLVTR